MSEQFSEEFKAAIRDFISAKGQPVKFEEGRDGHSWVSTYGWADYSAVNHTSPKNRYGGGGCRWIVPAGSFLYEESYSQFNGTGADNQEENGINVSGCHCACGKYTDVTLRWSGTLAQLINYIAPKETKRRGWLL